MRSSLRIVLYALSAFLAPAALASEYPQRYQLILPCFPTAAWADVARVNKLDPVDTRVDDDGDTWTIWEISGGGWRATLTVAAGVTTCIVAGRGKIQPGGTHL